MESLNYHVESHEQQLQKQQQYASWSAMRLVSSVSNFSDTVDVTYRQQVKDGLRETLLQSNQVNDDANTTTKKTMNCMHHYKPQNVRDCLLYGFDWQEMCRHYDDEMERLSCKKELSPLPSHHHASSSSSSTTPLGIIVGDFMLDPSVVPYALYSNVVQALLEVLLMDHHRHHRQRSVHSWTTSQNLLLETIVKLVRRSKRCLQQLGTLVIQSFETLLSTFHDDNEGNDMVETYQVQYALLKRLHDDDELLLSGQKRSVQIPGLLWIVQHMDDWDVRMLLLLSSRRQRDKDGDRDNHNSNDSLIHDNDNSNNKHKKRSRPKFATISELHGEVEEECTGTTTTARTTKKWVGPQYTTPPRITLKDVVLHHSKSNNNDNHGRHHHSNVKFTQLTLEAVLLRSKCYKALVEMASSMLTTNTTMTSKTCIESLFDQVIRCILLHHGDKSRSSTITATAAGRLCLVLVADAVTTILGPAATTTTMTTAAAAAAATSGYPILIQRLMLHQHLDTTAAATTTANTNQHLSRTELIWRMYSELLVDCSYFDSSHHCWQALQPLVQAIKSCSSVALTTTDPSSLLSSPPPPPSPQLQLLLRCLAYILSKRRRLLTTNTFNDDDDKDDESGQQQRLRRQQLQQVQDFLKTLSISFGDARYWIAPSSKNINNNMEAMERETILQTVQLLGIVSVVVDDDDGNDDDLSVEHDDIGDQLQGEGKPASVATTTNTNIWPFAEPNTLRCAYQRMGPNVCKRRQLLSRVNHDLHIPMLKQGENRSSSSCRTTDSCCAPPAALDYLHDDILGLIFSYLGYKRLVWVRQVCKTWKTIADQEPLWHHMYITRFHPVMPQHHHDDGDSDPNTTPSATKMHAASATTSTTSTSSSSWQELFKDKYQAERRIRFLRNKQTGWKVRTCGYVGCLTVLKNPEQLKRHYELRHTKTPSQRKRKRCSEQQQSQQPRRKRPSKKKEA